MNQLFLDSQKAMGDMMARSLSSLSLPTREDWNAISQRVPTLEERLRALESSLGQGEGAGRSKVSARTAPRPPRTRKPQPSSGGPAS